MKLLVVDDHEVVRKGLVAMLEGEDGIDIIREAEDMEEAKKLITIEQPDITIVDINLGGNNGLDLIEYIGYKTNVTKFVVFTSSSRKSDFIRAKELNVDGYILKDSNIEDIIYAIKSISRGRKFYDAQITREREADERNKVLESLTDREREIFQEVGRGLTNSQIAQKLYITENTVKKHMSSLSGKLGVKRRTEIALYATRLWRRKGEFV